MNKEIPGKVLTQKCTYYNGRGKCSFCGQTKCVYDKGVVPFPYVCGVEMHMEDQAMFGGQDE